MKNRKAQKTSVAKIGIIFALIFSTVAGAAWFLKKNKDENIVYKTEKLPYIEYTFNSIADFTKNTGVSARDKSKDYTLRITGNGNAETFYRNGCSYFQENGSLYLPQENNPFVNDLTDFTITVDVNISAPMNWFGAIFSWDSFSNVGADSTIDKYNRLETKYCDSDGTTHGADWVRFSDSNLMNAGTQWESYYNGKTLYTGIDGVESNPITIVYSLSAGNTLNIKAYRQGVRIGVLSYGISSWSLYDSASTYKMFMIGGCYDTRAFTSTLSFTQAEKFQGTMDNIRIYDFAMSEEQMAEYAATKKITVNGL